MQHGDGVRGNRQVEVRDHQAHQYLCRLVAVRSPAQSLEAAVRKAVKQLASLIVQLAEDFDFRESLLLTHGPQQIAHIEGMPIGSQRLDLIETGRIQQPQRPRRGFHHWTKQRVCGRKVCRMNEHPDSAMKFNRERGSIIREFAAQPCGPTKARNAPDNDATKFSGTVASFADFNNVQSCAT